MYRGKDNKSYRCPGSPGNGASRCLNFVQEQKCFAGANGTIGQQLQGGHNLNGVAGRECLAQLRVTLEIDRDQLQWAGARPRIRTSYPFVTEEHIKAARIYAAVHPKKGRPLRISESHPDLKPIRHGVIRRVPVRA